MKAKSYGDLFDKITEKKYIYESGLLIENGVGETVFSKTYGEKGLDTPMTAASITKMFTATCIFILIQKGFIALDDKLSKFYEPAFLKGLHIYKGKEYSNNLKISDLLYQTSGLADIYEEGKNSIKRQIITSDKFLPFTQCVALTKETKSHFPPNNKAKAYYADINYDILGNIIEIVMQCPLEQVFVNYVFSEAGMKNTYLPISEKEHIPPVYYKNKRLYRPQFIISSRASGGCITTIRDLMLFIKAFFQGKLFDIKMLDKLTQFRKLQFAMFPICYGSGYMRIKTGGLSTSFLGKGDLIGHSGSTGSFAFYYPYKDLFLLEILIK